MTKRHFIALADAIKAYNQDWPPSTIGIDAGFSYGQLAVLADFCQAMNPSFNRQRWLNYIEGHCGPNGGRLPSTHSTSATERNN